MTAPVLLLIETSGDICSVALARLTGAFAELSKSEKNSHSQHLAPMVDKLLQINSIKLTDLSAIAISGGPGSYTGLRIGASFAKGLCYAVGLPLIAVSSLAVIAAAMKEVQSTQQYNCALIDARRSDAYFAVFDTDLKHIGEEAFATIDKEGFLKELEGTVCLGGSGAEKALPFCGKNVGHLPVVVEARHLTPFAFAKFEAKEFEDLAYFEPNYIKAVHITSPKKKTFL